MRRCTRRARRVALPAGAWTPACEGDRGFVHRRGPRRMPLFAAGHYEDAGNRRGRQAVGERQ